MLGKLAKWLRILGYDTLYYQFIDDNTLIRNALIMNRTLLTRDEEAFQKFESQDKLFIRSAGVMEQLKQVIEEMGLDVESQLLTRCVLCNAVLTPLDKGSVKDLVPEYVFKTQQNFSFCNLCKKVYWKGTHRTKMIEKLKNLESLVTL
jgi:hypothetical protein